MLKKSFSVLLAVVMLICVFILSTYTANAKQVDIAEVGAQQKAMFIMGTLNISQGMYGSFSHQGSKAIDITGNDTGIDPAYAPFDGKVVYVSTSSAYIIYESTSPVEFADGTVDYMSLWVMHDNDVGRFYVGQTFSQGEHFFNEGSAGYATGNHIHLECAQGTYQGMYKNDYGVWCIKNQINPYDALYLSESTYIIDGYGYNWRITTPSATGANIGDDFYAYIITDTNWIHLTAIDNNKEKNNVELSMANSDTDPKQIWHFIRKNNNNHYEIVNEYDNKALDISTTNDYSNIQTFPKNDSDGQRWFLTLVTENTDIFTLHPVCAGNMAMDVGGGSISRGNNIQLFTSNGTQAQAFWVYKLDWNGYNYSVPTPEKPIITSAYADGDVLHLKWTESASTSIFDTNRQYEVRIEDSENNIVEWVNVGNVTEYSYVIPKQGRYTVKVIAVTKSYNTTAKYNEGTWAAAEPRQVLYGIEPCASVTNENTYLLFDVDVNYESAKEYCESLGGHLATITKESEQQVIASLILNGSAGYYWLGGTDAESEGKWKWTTGEDWTYSNWNQGEPNNDQGNENNMTIIKQTSKWNDRPATVRNGFICEIDTVSILGDADGDGTVTIVDATAIQRYLAQYPVSNEEALLRCGDVNGGGLDIMDATAIQRFLVGLPTYQGIGEAIKG